MKHKGELTCNYGNILAGFLKVKARMEMVKNNKLTGYDDENTRSIYDKLRHKHIIHGYFI